MPFDRDEYMKQYRKKPEAKATKNAWHRSRNQENRVMLSALKVSLGCCVCGEKDPRCLDLHHRDPEQKLYEVSALIGRSTSWEMIEAEAKKCDVMCANCHRKLHAPLY